MSAALVDTQTRSRHLISNAELFNIYLSRISWTLSGLQTTTLLRESSTFARESSSNFSSPIRSSRWALNAPSVSIYRTLLFLSLVVFDRASCRQNWVLPKPGAPWNIAFKKCIDICTMENHEELIPANSVIWPHLIPPRRKTSKLLLNFTNNGLSSCPAWQKTERWLI